MSTILSSSTATGASGATYVAGLSGLDSAALIKAAVEAKMQPAYIIDNQVKALQSKTSAYSTMSGLLKGLSSAVESLSGRAGSSVFDRAAAYLTSKLDDPASYLGTTVTDGAALGVYEIEVQRLATSHKVASAEQASDTALGLNGSFTLAADGSTGSTITVTADMTVSDVADAINAASADTGVVATVIATGDGVKTLVLSTSETGVSMTASGDTGGVLTGLGLTAADGSFANELQAAQDAILTVDGVTVTSADNDIEDLLPGVSVNLYAATAGETITLEVGQDLGAAMAAIEAFVDAFNEYRAFAITQQQTEAGVGAAEDAVLFGEATLKSSNAALYEAIGTTVEVDGVTHTLATLGLKLGAGSMLSIDKEALEETLLQRPEVIEAFFASTGSSSSADLGVVSLPATVDSGNYTVDVTVDAGTGAITAATINGVALEVSGTTLRGVAGSAYEGLTMVYTGTSSASVTLEVSQGMADQVMSMVDTYTDQFDGLVTAKQDSLATVIEDKQARRAEIAASTAAYEERLIIYYAKLEQQIALAKTRLQYLDAILNRDDD